MENLILLAFSSASQALKGEKALKRAGIQCALVPVPRYLSEQCGVGLRVTSSDRPAAVKDLESAGILISAVYDLARGERGGRAAVAGTAGPGGADGMGGGTDQGGPT